MLDTLKGKISLVYLSLVLVIAIVGIISVLNLYSLSKAINGLMTDNYKSINAVTNMLEAVERQDSAMLIYMNVDRQKGIDMFSENTSTFNEWFDIERNNITELGEQTYVDKINNYYELYLKSFSQLQELHNVDTNKAVSYYNTKIIPDFNDLKKEMSELSLLNEKAMFSKKANVTNNTRKSMYILLLLSAFAVTGGFLLSRISTNRFLTPIYSLTQTIKLVKAGDLNKQIKVTSTDEIGELAEEFNNMTKRLQQYEQSTLGQLMTEKNKSLAIVKSITDPIIVLDVNYKIVLLNNAFEKFFNIREEKVVNRHFLEAVRNGEIFDHITSVMNSKEEYKEKIVYVKSDEEYYFNVVVTNIKDANSNITGLIAVFQNVTQLKKLEKVKTDFLATISHELKTPLTSIVMGTSLILDESMGLLNADQKSVISTMNEDEIKLSNLVNELLELSKIESDRAIFNIESCSIEGIIETSIRQFFEQSLQKDLSLYSDVEDNLPKVKADDEKILWVVNNLITNALKYTNAGDEISIKAYAKDKLMYVTVKDTGIGIPEEFQERIFEKFIQVKGQDKEVRGTGLGLSIVKDIIEAHHGTIKCESKLDVGSTFTFTLPLSEKE